MVNIALFEPEIPHNTGALMRLCACLDVELHIIEPMGFVLSDKHLKRAGMDYRDMANVTCHASFDTFLKSQNDRRIILLDTKGTVPLYDFEFHENDVLLFGKESSGVPNWVFDHADHSVFIPMKEECRSLNLALTAAMVLGEARRQVEVI